MEKDKQGVQGSCGAGKRGVATQGEMLVCAQGPTMEAACFRTLVSAVEESRAGRLS